MGRFFSNTICLLGASVAASLFSYAAYAESKATPCCRRDGNPRWYAGISGSVVFLQDVNIGSSSASYPTPDKQAFKPGFAVSANVGYKVFSGVRAELEIIQRTNDVEKDSTGTLLPPGMFAEQKSVAIMANGYIDLRNSTNFTPYAGAGIGKVFVKNPRYYTDNNTGETSKKLAGWATAYQFMLGVSYTIENTPFELTGGYRYFTSQDVEDKSSLTNFPSTLNFNNDSSNIEFGARLNF